LQKKCYADCEKSGLYHFVLLFRSCGVANPSWAEICYFVTFLDLQLVSCENSVFTDHELTGDIFKGFKGFVVKFMMKMSRVSSSLKGEVAIENSETLNTTDNIGSYQIDHRKKWEQRLLVSDTIYTRLILMLFFQSSSLHFFQPRW